MRYAENHKDETHKAILKVAAAQLRELGPDRISVGSVMKAAGLTHGGFYAHFKSKDALMIEALLDTFDRSPPPRRARLLEGLPPRPLALATYISTSMSPKRTATTRRTAARSSPRSTPTCRARARSSKRRSRAA